MKTGNNLFPTQFDTFFYLNLNVHQHDTRQSFSLHVTFHRSNIRANSIKILGPKLWNSLCSSITSLPSFHILKTRCFHSILKKLCAVTYNLTYYCHLSRYVFCYFVRAKSASYLSFFLSFVY